MKSEIIAQFSEAQIIFRGCRKRQQGNYMGANETVWSLASKVEASYQKACNNCRMPETHNSFLQCRYCRTVRHCSTQVEKAQWSEDSYLFCNFRYTKKVFN